jgi:2',3'-cyclic-nucleotide 2'-phosphodiesterase / 3'-nucleotidase / 5'-nucleotidase
MRRVVFLLGALACSTAGSRERATSSVTPGAERDTVEIVIAATTDVHGRLRGWDYYTARPDSARGLSRAATIIDSLRRANPARVVLVDAGDLLQGNPLTDDAARVDTQLPHPVIAAMNVMHYDAAAVGNHEFNYGLATLARATGSAAFPLLAANAWRSSGQRAFPASTIVHRAGLKVAIVGATNPGVAIWDRENVRGRVEVRDIVSEVRRAVDEVRKQKPDVIVAVLHSGLDEVSSYDTVSSGVPSENVSARVAREVPGIDVIVYGHSHREQPGLTSGSTLLIQPRNWATSVAVATLRVARGHGVVTRRGTVVQAAGHVEDSAVVAVTRAAHDATVRFVARPTGETRVAWSSDSARVADTPLIDFINETQRRKAGADLSATAAFTLASIDSGPITVAEIARLYPYENTLRAVRITGAQLRAYLEHSARYYRTFGTTPLIDSTVPGYNFDMISGVEYTLDLSKPLGARVTSLVARGRLVAPTDTFTLALNNYRQAGGGGYAMLSGAPVVYDSKEDIRQLLIDEVTRRGTLRPEDYFTRNWHIQPAAAVAQAAAELAPRPRPATGATSRSDAHLTNGRWLRIIATNDFHGALEPRADSTGVVRGGAAYLATEIRNARSACVAPRCESLWLDGGDLFQGTPASNLAFGRPVMTIFNALGLTAAALGNHEFDWGLDTLRAHMRETRYAILGANVRDAGGRDISWIRDDTLVTVGSLKVGVIGAALVETPTVTKVSIVKDLRFADPAPIIDAHARALRARGADRVIVVAHIGAFCQNSLTSCRGGIVDLANRLAERVDAIVSGHTHSPVRALVRGIPIVQARSRGIAIGIIDIPLGDTTKTAVIELRDVRADWVSADSSVAAVVRDAAEKVAARMSVPVVEIGEHIGQGLRGTLGKLIADAQRFVGQGDVSIMNNGGIRAPLRPGMATYGSLFEVHPFDNRLVRLTVTGKELRAELERQVAQPTFNLHLSGVRVAFDTSRAAGSRVTSLTRTDGTAIRDTERYRVVLSDFLADGGDQVQLANSALRREDLDIPDLEALIRYLKTLPAPVRAPRDERIAFVAP